MLNKSFKKNGVEILKKKKCQVHNGHADLKLLLTKKIKVVISVILVILLSFFEKINNHKKVNRDCNV